MKALKYSPFAFLALLALISPGFLATGCERDTPSQTQPAPGGPQSLPAVKMKIGDRTFNIEVARTSDQQAIGLMKRDSMPEDHGMIFTFDEERLLEFWMKDTRIPLDIMYLDANGKVVSVSTMQPYDLTSVSSQVPAKYAIELNAGMVKKLGIKAGDAIDVSPALKGPNKPPTTKP
jgi:uncharacterized membrane protein (UPF0127 family)